jgi:hypothetical protein
MLPPTVDPMLSWASPTLGFHPRSRFLPFACRHRSDSTRDASTALDVTAFPPHCLRNETVTAWTLASFRTARPRRSKLLLGSPNTEMLSTIAYDRSHKHLTFVRPSPRPNPLCFFTASRSFRCRNKPENSRACISTNSSGSHQDATEVVSRPAGAKSKFFALSKIYLKG